MLLAPGCPEGGPQRWTLTLSLWGSHGLAKHNEQMLFHARGKKINENPLHPINSENVAFVRLIDQAFKPSSLEIQML